ncbi:MAG: sigma-70 family RNA polymerase sigma factor [Thermoanaerobaculia bacterium]|nr:sigma-70 family RNA polymerase sigma factor [Thermoanaerobaculia bacterium]
MAQTTQPTSPDRDPRDELQLLAAYRDGDREAAEVLVDRTYGLVFAALFRLTGGDEDLTADLTQEAYRRAWQALPRFRGRSRVSTWLYRIAYTTFLNHVRRPRAVQPPEVAPEPADPAPDPQERAATASAQRRLRRAVLDLPDDLRFPVTARFWGEVPVREIARQEGLTPQAVNKRLRKAMRRLADTLQEDTP